jgi:hypothetical protein
MGRPTKLTPQVQKRICDAILRGHTYEIACRLGGISDETLSTWREKGEKGIEPYAGFLGAFTRAVDDHENEMLQIVYDAAMKGLDDRGPDWRAASWTLERRHPERWAKREKHEVTGEGGGPLVVKVISYKDS